MKERLKFDDAMPALVEKVSWLFQGEKVAYLDMEGKLQIVNETKVAEILTEYVKMKTPQIEGE